MSVGLPQYVGGQAGGVCGLDSFFVLGGVVTVPVVVVVAVDFLLIEIA